MFKATDDTTTKQEDHNRYHETGHMICGMDDNKADQNNQTI